MDLTLLKHAGPPLLALACSLIAASATALPPTPPPLTLQEKVDLADYIVAGVAKRIVYFQYSPGERRSTLMDREPHASDPANALLEVEIEASLLWEPAPAPALVRVFVPERAIPNVLTERYLNKNLVFFLRRGSYSFDPAYAQENVVYYFARGRHYADPEAFVSLEGMQKFVARRPRR